jgi:5-methylcytosine-specific restriction endonuclease McrA
MTRRKTSIVWTINLQELQKLLDNSSSFVEVLISLGLSAHSGNHRTLQERIKIDNLNIEKLRTKRKEKIASINTRRKIDLANVFIKNSNYSTKTVKNKIIKENLIPYICTGCGNNGEWHGKKIVLQLEHKNGDSKDHSLENLCFLCPNCHSQTETYSGRNTKKPKIKKFCSCGREIRPNSTRCNRCPPNRDHLQKFHVIKEDLETMIKEMPITQIGKIFGVSDNSIRKRCKKFGIDYGKRKSV